MPSVSKPLTETFIKNIRDRGPKKYFDGGGLYLYLSPTGSKTFRVAYNYNGKSDTLTLGPYPVITLKDAREKRDEANKLRLEGKNPKSMRHNEQADSLTFETVAMEWYNKQKPAWKYSHYRNVEAMLKRYIIPAIGNRPVKDLTSKDILEFLHRLG